MYVDFWILSLFSVLFGICAVWNRKRGLQEDVQGTLELLKELKIIEIENDEIIPARKTGV